jgi:hypothetical protein
MNDLCSANFHARLTEFADDTALTYSDADLNLIYEHMCSDLKLLNYWFSKNDMILSEKKNTVHDF